MYVYVYVCDTGLARFEKFNTIMNKNIKTMLEIDARYLDPSLPTFYDTLRTLDRKYTGFENSKTFNEKVLILDLSSDEMTQKVLDQVGISFMYKAYPDERVDFLAGDGITITGFKLTYLVQLCIIILLLDTELHCSQQAGWRGVA